jgi:hypothetical protein
MDLLDAVATQIRSQSLNSVVSGFAFASAIAWMDLVRWFLSTIISVKSQGGQYYLLTALLTSLISVLVFVLIQRVTKEDIKATAATFAVTR